MIKRVIKWLKRKDYYAVILTKVNDNYYQVVGKKKINPAESTFRFGDKEFIIMLNSGNVIETDSEKLIYYLVDDSKPLSFNGQGDKISPELIGKIINTNLWSKLLAIAKPGLTDLVMIAAIGIAALVLGMYIGNMQGSAKTVTETVTVTVIP